MTTIKDLTKFIIDSGYPYDLVEFEKEYPNEAYCIRQTENRAWEVYYSERGTKNGLVEFASESEASESLIEKIKKESTTRRLKE